MTNLTHVLKSSVQSSKSISQKKTDNIYVFKVGRLSNKFQIKFVLESIFKVKVEKVCVSLKKPFLKNRLVKTSLDKKAFVKLKNGYKIDDFEKIIEIIKNFVVEQQNEKSFDNNDNSSFSKKSDIEKFLTEKS